MAKNFCLSKDQTALIIVDVQEKLMPYQDRSAEVLNAIHIVTKAFKILGLPIIVTEQYPQGLGSTVPGLKSLLGDEQIFFAKTTFSCLKTDAIQEAIAKTNAQNWVVIGIESHVCVLQTAKDLVKQGKDVVVLNDATTSRSIYNFSTAIAEMKDIGVRISCTETVLFELMEDSKALEFKKISQLIK